jgi:hypothetical protein
MLPTVRRRSGRHSPPLFISAVASSERNNHEHIAQHESTTCGKRLSQFTQESDLPQPPPNIPVQYTDTHAVRCRPARGLRVSGSPATRRGPQRRLAVAKQPRCGCGVSSIHSSYNCCEDLACGMGVGVPCYLLAQ